MERTLLASRLAECALAWFEDAERYKNWRRSWRIKRGEHLSRLAYGAWEACK